MASSALRPEDEVRRRFIAYLISLGYPEALILQEHALSELPHLKDTQGLPYRRVDVLVYGLIDKKLEPLILIECKHEVLSEKTWHQAMGYNFYVKAPFVACVSSLGFFLYDIQQNLWLKDFPSYDKLILQASSSISSS